MKKLLIILLLCSSAFGQQKPMLGEQVNRAHQLGDFVGAWFMLEGSGNKVFDLSGNGNDGSFAGWNIPWVGGLYGSALKFTGGSNNAITIPHSASLNLSSRVTVAARFIHDGVAWDTHNTVIAKGAWDEGYGLLVLDDGKARFIAEDPLEATDYVESASTLSVGQWYDLVGTYDGSNLRIFINGVLDNTAARTGAVVTNANNIEIQMGDSGWDWTGRFSYVMIYNRALSASEIALLYREPFCMFADEDVAMLEASIPAPTGGQVIIIQMSAIPLLLITAFCFVMGRKNARFHN